MESLREQAVKAVMELTDNLGTDAVLDFVNASKTMETDMKFLRRRARLVLVGLFGGELKLGLVSMPTGFIFIFTITLILSVRIY